MRAIQTLLNCNIHDLPAVTGPGTGTASWACMKDPALKAIAPLPSIPTYADCLTLTRPLSSALLAAV